jgi:hemoglobin
MSQSSPPILDYRARRDRPSPPHDGLRGPVVCFGMGFLGLAMGWVFVVRAIVDDFTARAMADPRVNWKRVGVTRGGFNFKRNVSVEWTPAPAQIDGMKYHIVQFLSLATGGPSKYEGREMANVHKGLHITNAEFDASIGDFKATLDKLGVATAEQKEVLAILESARPQVVEER